MERSQLTGIVLMMAILIGYFVWFAPEQQPETQQPTTTEQQKSPETKPKKEKEEQPSILSQNDSLRNLLNQEKFGAFAAAVEGEQKDVVLENDKIKLTLDTKGGRVKSVLIKDYLTYNNEPLYLLDEEHSTQDLLIETERGEINISDLYFNTSATQVTVEEDNSGSVSFQLDLGNGRSITQVYTLAAGEYQVDYQLDMNGMNQLITGENLTYHWHNNMKRLEKHIEGPHGSRQKATINYYTVEEDFDYLSHSDETESETIEEDLKWVAFKQKFFTAALIAQETSLKGAQLSTTVNAADTMLIKKADMTLQIPVADLQSERGKFTYFFGPNKYNVLKKVTDQFDENLYLGWGIFSWINRFVIIPVFHVLEGFIGNYGLIIIILVFFIKIILLPLSYKSYISMAKMRVLKPQMEEVKKEYPDDMAKQQSATMELYQKVGVNPLSGCIPVVLQIPILFAMFNFFPNSIELRQEPFLWTDDLSTYDAIINLPFYIPGYGDHVSLFTLLMTAATLLYTWSNSQVSGGMGAGPMKAFPYIMPFIFMFVLNSYPAGLSFYYFVSNVVTFGQQTIIGKFVDDKKVKEMLAKSQQRRKEKGKSGKSSFQQRLEQAMKAAEEQKKNKNKGKK
jgi:YidC/Oxa1 family membrane protein insertase